MAADYTIVGQLERNAPDPDTGQIVPGVQVQARSAKTGTVFSVFVPASKFSIDNVDTLVRHRLAIVDGVAALGGESASSG